MLTEQGPPKGSYTSPLRDQFRAYCEGYGLGHARRHILAALLREVDHRNATWPRLTGRQRQPTPRPVAELADAIDWSRQPVHRALVDFERQGIVLYPRSRGAGGTVTVLAYPSLVHLPPEQFYRVADAITERVQALGAPAPNPAAPKSARGTLETETLPSEQWRGTARFPGRKATSDTTFVAHDLSKGHQRQSADPVPGPWDECPECLDALTDEVQGRPVDNEPVELEPWWGVS
jgi:hypothetical protein